LGEATDEPPFHFGAPSPAREDARPTKIEFALFVKFVSRLSRKNRVGAANIVWQSEDMNDYERIAQIIRFLDGHHAEQPDLATLAGHAGLSPFHFHRLFSAWAGVTPKDFLQCLTLAHAKELLSNGSPVLGAALESGLSGPGRLHDLCVNLEAASPGELKSGGAGWTITFGFADSPFGICLIAESPRGICHLSFVENETTALAELQKCWPQAKLKRDDSNAEEIAGRIFRQIAGSETGTPLRAFVRGTPFQLRVWRALLQVRPGALTSYGRLANAIGEPTAPRAVGAAVGRNPLAYLIPCHRVIRETGVTGDYHWGATRKRVMIAWEGSQRFSGVLAAEK
jgi:AraC family transcriptional regulator of adaptative response/methylated-DNA-[protein]-cysteine methyltransferase